MVVCTPEFQLACDTVTTPYLLSDNRNHVENELLKFGLLLSLSCVKRQQNHADWVSVSQNGCVTWFCYLLTHARPLLKSNEVHLQETAQDTSLWLGLSPIDTSTPNDLLMLWNCFIYFAVGHRCCATEPGFAEDIGAIEIWLIDWLICEFRNTLKEDDAAHCYEGTR